MRRIPRKSLVAACTLVAALGLASLAAAVENTQNVAQGVAGINPNKQSATKFGRGSLFTQVTSYDQDNNPVIPDQSAEKVTVDYDDSGKITTAGLAQCDPASLEATTVQQALNTCGSSLVGSGNAIARVPGVPATNNEADLTVTDFNGTPSSGAGCLTPGVPTVILHARSDQLGLTVVVIGEIKNSPNATGDYGKRLDVCDAPDVAGDLGALVLFNSQTDRQFTDNTGKKRFYITARCDDANKIWNSAYHWQYDDGTTDDDTSTQQCGT